MKRFLSVILAVCMGILGALSLAGCNKSGSVGGGESKAKYYIYNVESDVFDKTEYLEIDGNNCTLVKNTDGTTVTANGSITFTGDSFTISCASELLGIPLTTVMNGVREANGVLRVNSQTVLGMTSTPATDYEVTYYCPDGVKPVSPFSLYTITFNANGGKFDNNASTKNVKTTADGLVALPDAPTKDGYDFAGYYVNKDSGGTAISSSTKFDHSMTVYARWTAHPIVSGKYYFYDKTNDTYDRNDYFEVDGTKIVFVGKDGGLTVRMNGTISYVGNNFTIALTNEIGSGISVDMSMTGECATNGILHITGMTVGDETDSVSMYYCPDGVKPVDPVLPAPPPGSCTVNFYSQDGVYPDGSNKIVLTTDPETGTLAEIPPAPTRDGYLFKGFATMTSSAYITTSTVFTEDTDAFAMYAKLHTVTFKVEGLMVETRQVEYGAPLGETSIPDLSDVSPSKYHMFKGWYDGNEKYISTTLIAKDVTLNAQFFTTSDAQTVLDNMFDFSQAGHLYIHYRRNDQITTSTTFRAVDKYSIKTIDSAYSDWLLWAWPDDGFGRTFEPIYVGIYGIVFDIDMTTTYKDGGWDSVNKKHGNESVNFYGKGFNFMIFNNVSRMNGDSFWRNDGGNNNLPREAFEYWEVDQPSDIKYIFDENLSCHLLLEEGNVAQAIENRTVTMITFGYDSNIR